MKLMEVNLEQAIYRLIDKVEAYERRMDARLLKLEQELFFYKRVIKWVQVSGAVLLAVATFKFGDIKSLFK